MGAQRDPCSETDWSRFWAQSDYAHSIVCTALGDRQSCLEALHSALENDPSYAPAILSLGSLEYQLGRSDQGRRLLMSLLALPDDTDDLTQMIDRAGEFLISIGAYSDGLELFCAGASRFPQATCLLQGLTRCAGRAGLAPAAATGPADGSAASDPDGWEQSLPARAA